MRAVRCDVCGSKALLAAATCPKCGHEFQVRDGFGKLLPLAYCSSCDSFYPEKVGECRWCGTKPERPPSAPYVWKTAGVVALVAVVGVAWFSNRDGANSVAEERMKVVLAGDSAADRADSIRRSAAAAAGDSSTRTTTVAASAGSIATDTVEMPAQNGVVVPPTATPADTLAPAEPVRALPTPVAAPRAKPAPVASSPSASYSSSRSRKSVRWVSSVSHTWVMVHADASKNSRIVASIGPNTRVQLGETRGAWRRIRAKGLSGWVEHSAFVAMVGAPHRGRGLAVR